MSLLKQVIRVAVSFPKIESFDRYLFIGPHPDDIEIGAGATVRKLTEAEKSVTFLICTDGRFGDGFSNGVKGDDLAALRKEESIVSAKKLGVTDVRFLDLCDGAGYTRETLEKGIAEVISNVQPDILFAPDPLSKSESHADHLMVGEAVRKLAYFAPYGGIMENLYKTAGAPVKALAFYMTARPNRYVKTAKYFDDQLSAIFDCHKSQYPPSSQESDALKLYLKLRKIQFGIRTLSRGAEGFRVYNETHMHCLPEAGE